MIKDLVSQENLKLSNAVSTAKGFVATHKNVMGALPPVSLMLGGKTVQKGTPTPDNKVDIEGAGASGKLKAVSTAKNVFGGLALAQALVDSGSTNVVLDTDAKTITFRHNTNSSNTEKRVLFDNFKENTQYTIMLKGMCLEDDYADLDNFININVQYTDGTRKQFVFSEPNVETQIIYTTSAGKSVDCIRYDFNVANKNMLNYEQCGVFEGVITADEFEAYTGTQADIPLSAPLYEGDYIRYNMDGSGELTRNRNSVVFDGSSDEAISLQSINSYGIANFYASLPVKAKTETAISNRFEPQKTLIGNTMNEGVYNNETLFYIRIKQERAKTVGELKTWLQANPITVVYELAEPTVTPLTTLKIKAIESLVAQDGLTNVMSEGMVESAYLANNADGKLISELINIYDAKINELQSDVDTVEEKMIYCGEGDSYMGVNYDGEIAKITIAENESREIYMSVKQILEQHDKVLELLAAK